MPEISRKSVHIEKINTIEITNLWGRYNFKWDLNDDVNILTGINGSGKTTIFRIIESIFNASEYFSDSGVNGAYDKESDFFKKMKIREHDTKVKITFNDVRVISGNQHEWGGFVT